MRTVELDAQGIRGIVNRVCAVVALLTVASGLIMPLPAEAVSIYDLATDWSDLTNPNGLWSLNKSPGTPFTNHIADYDNSWLSLYTAPQPAWADAIPQLPGHVPLWMKIVSPNTRGWDQPIGSVVMHGAEGLNPPVWPGVTWTSPLDGTVLISGGVWMANEDLGRIMVWQILRDSELKTSGTIRKSDGYSSSNLFDFADGSGGPEALVIPVSVGTVITFQADKPYGFAHVLGVELTMTLTPIPEPGTFLLLGSGLAGLAAWRRRKRAIDAAQRT